MIEDLAEQRERIVDELGSGDAATHDGDHSLHLIRGDASEFAFAEMSREMGA